VPLQVQRAAEGTRLGSLRAAETHTHGVGNNLTKHLLRPEVRVAAPVDTRGIAPDRSGANTLGPSTTDWYLVDSTGIGLF